MHIPSLHPVSETEVSSFPTPSSRKIWNTVRSTSEPTSPRSLSPDSEHFSEISYLQSQNLSPAPLHTSPEFISSPSVLPHLSNPPTSLPIPQSLLPFQSLSDPLLPISPMVMNTSPYVISPLARMPMRHTKNAPTLFKGSYRRVTRFISHYSQLLDACQVTSDRDKCHGILEYCSQKVEDFIKSCPHFIVPNWDALKQDILKYYDAERMDSRIQLSDFVQFLVKGLQQPMTNLTQWRKYNREYLANAGFLREHEQLDDEAVDGYFWFGIPESLRNVLDQKLQAKYPSHDTAAKPWSMEEVQEVAETYLKRNTYSDRLYHLPALGIMKRHDDDESDDESEEDSDDDYEKARKQWKKEKEKKKKKEKSAFKFDRKPLPLQTLKEEPSRAIVAPPEDGRIESMIHQLNTMSLEDPRYGSLYYKVVKDDSKGLAAQCIMRKPKQQNFERPIPRDVPPRFNPPPSVPVQPPYPRGIIPYPDGRPVPRPDPPKCYGCMEIGHVLRYCPKVSNMLSRKVITLDNNFKYRFPDGQLITRRPDESLIQCVERLRPSQSHQVQYATVKNAVENFYRKVAKSYRDDDESDCDDSDDDSDDSDIESEEDDYDEAHWTWRSQRRHEYPQVVAYEAIDEEDQSYTYEAYPVERSDRVTRQTRNTAMKYPVQRTKFDGVYIPPRRPPVPMKAPEKVPERVPLPVAPRPSPPHIPRPSAPIRSKENIPPPEIPLVPVDARKPRFVDQDIVMKEAELMSKEAKGEKKPVILQDHQNRSGITEEKKVDFDPAVKPRTGPRQSELSAQVNSKAVVQQILDTPVSIPLRDILGTSKEISSNFQDIIKLKNPVSKMSPSLAAYEVMNGSVRNDETIHLEENYNPDYTIGYTPQDKALIKLPLYSNGKLIVAVIDTGSQLNIVSPKIAEEIVQLPVNTTETVVMNDANGNSGELKGLIKKAPLRCGEVLTEADLYIGPSNVPFDLLLGRPWQRSNMITIDERDRGTYIVFKDFDTGEPKCEVFINSSQILRPPVKTHKKQVFAAVEDADDFSKEGHQKTSETLVTPLLDSPNEVTLKKTSAETLEEPLDESLKIIEEHKLDIIQDLADGLQKFHLENLSNTRPEPPTRVVGGSLDILAAVCDQIHRIQENTRRKEDISPKEDLGEITLDQNGPEDKENDTEDTCQTKEFINGRKPIVGKDEFLCSNLEEGACRLLICTCHCQEKDFCDGSKAEVQGKPPENPQDVQIFEPEYLGMERSYQSSITDSESSADQEINSVQEYMYTLRDLKTNQNTDPPAMTSHSQPYCPPTDGPLHPTLHVPMHVITALFARDHGASLVNRTDFSYIPPTPLTFDARNVLLATNNSALEEGPETPFAYAELASLDASLSFKVDGITHKIKGEAYIQFSYFIEDEDGQKLLKTFNAHPPYPSNAPRLASVPKSPVIVPADLITATKRDRDSVMEAEPAITEIHLEAAPEHSPTSFPLVSLPLSPSADSTDPGHVNSLVEKTSDGELPRVFHAIVRALTQTKPLPDNEIFPQVGAKTVLLATVASPLLPQSLFSPPDSPRLHRNALGLIVNDEEKSYDISLGQPGLQDRELESITLLKKPSASGDPEDWVPSSTPTVLSPFVFAYGPFIKKNPSNPLSPFEYRVFVFSPPDPLQTPFQVAFGNPPHVPIELITVESRIDEDFIAGLTDDQIRFLILTNYLLVFRDIPYSPRDFLINDKHLAHGWRPLSVDQRPLPVERYPFVEILLSLATHFIHQPDGLLAGLFRQYHRWASNAIFKSPSHSLRSDTSSEFSSCLTDHESYQWEEVSDLTSETDLKDEPSAEGTLSISARPPTPFFYPRCQISELSNVTKDSRDRR